MLLTQEDAIIIRTLLPNELDEQRHCNEFYALQTLLKLDPMLPEALVDLNERLHQLKSRLDEVINQKEQP